MHHQPRTERPPVKAVRFYDQGDIRVEQAADPKPQAGGLLVKVQACAICGTDLKMFLSGNPRVKPPQTIGHEFVGQVIELGPDTQGFTPGDRVTMATSISCGQCPVCRQGRTNRCEKLACVSYDYPGAFAQYLAIPPAGVQQGNVVKVPPDLGDLAALAEPLSCAINAQILAGVQPGDTVVVAGCGPLGAIHAQLARANGTAQIIITERAPTRLQLAQTLNVDAVIDASSSDVIAEVMKLTADRGADVVIVTAPSKAAQEQALSLARKGGMINLFASLPRGASDLTLDARLIHYRELFLSGASDSTPQHVHTAVDLLARGLIDEKVVTHTLPLDQFMQGLDLMQQMQSFKVLLKMEP